MAASSRQYIVAAGQPCCFHTVGHSRGVQTNTAKCLDRCTSPSHISPLSWSVSNSSPPLPTPPHSPPHFCAVPPPLDTYQPSFHFPCRCSCPRGVIPPPPPPPPNPLLPSSPARAHLHPAADGAGVLCDGVKHEAAGTPGGFDPPPVCHAVITHLARRRLKGLFATRAG